MYHLWLGPAELRCKGDWAWDAAPPTCVPVRCGGTPSPGRCNHSDTPLYISLAMLRTRYTGRRQNAFIQRPRPGAPDCAALRRGACFAVPQTCGACADGYGSFDDATDGNSTCGPLHMFVDASLATDGAALPGPDDIRARLASLLFASQPENGPGPTGGVQAPLAFSTVNRLCMALLYGRAGGFAAKHGGFRPRAVTMNVSALGHADLELHITGSKRTAPLSRG